jgi:hypothetical protein
MLKPTIWLRLALALVSVASLTAQHDGEAAAPSQDSRILLRYSTFDPLVRTPEVPPALRASTDTNLWIVQFRSAPTDGDRAALQAAGGVVRGYLPHDSHVVLFVGDGRRALGALPRVRWVGAYEPAYRLEPFLLTEHLSGAAPRRRYDMVMADKRGDKQVLAARITALGGRVVDMHLQSLLFTVELDGAQLLAAARLDEVLWINRWSEPGTDMDNARIQGGANAIEIAGGYTGAGIRGHVYEGVEASHPDFTVPLVNVRSGGVQTRHGHCTAGIVFGNGTSASPARGLAPAALGYYTDYTAVTPGWSRNMVIDEVVNVHRCMFTTASWGGNQTPLYNATSADADDIVFDHRIPWTQSMSNLGNTNARPEAWAKNVISVGGVVHFNNSTPIDDSWLAGNASIGPAQDGRIKPDLVSYYEQVWTSDLSAGLANNDPLRPGTFGGYNNAPDPSGQSHIGFGGTSAATPIVAGHNALAIQMYTDHLFNNTVRVPGGTRFQNRPYAQTLKALMIVGADQYTPTATDNRREHVGWGHPNLNNLWTRRDRFMVIPEDVPITQGATHTYQVRVLPGETALKVCLTYLDPPGNPASAIARINDLTLQVTAPTGASYWGNVGLAGASQTNTSLTGGSANTIDTVECVLRPNPTSGIWTIMVTAPTVVQDAHLATPQTDATYALVVNGGTRVYGSGCARYVPDFSPTGPGNYWPWGGDFPATLQTTFANNNSGSVGGTVYYNLTVNQPLVLGALNVNSLATAGTELRLDVYRTPPGGTHVGNELNPAAWIPMTAGKGVAAGVGVASRVDLAKPIQFAPGTYGIAIVANNFAHAYTNGTGSNQNYSNAAVAIAAGSATNGAFGGLGGVFSPRVANTTLLYRPESALGTNMRYQTVLRRGELGPAGAITGLAFSGSVTGRHWNSSLLVRMAHVPAGFMPGATFDLNLPAPVTVLDQQNHSFEFATGEWREIGLQNPFAYNGTSDVVVDIIARGNWQTTPGTFNRGDEPRVFATGWTTTPPATGTVDALAARMRVTFNCADANEFGASCGPLEAGHVGDGRRNSTFYFTVAKGPPSSVVFLGLGLANTAPFPVSLTSFGWINCHGWHGADVMLGVSTTALGTAAHPLVVPNTAANDGLKVYGTWIALDPSEPGDLTFSNYTRMIVGLEP